MTEVTTEPRCYEVTFRGGKLAAMENLDPEEFEFEHGLPEGDQERLTVGLREVVTRPGWLDSSVMPVRVGMEFNGRVGVGTVFWGRHAVGTFRVRRIFD